MSRRATRTRDTSAEWIDTDLDAPLERRSESRSAAAAFRAEAKLLVLSLGGTLAVLWTVQLVNALSGYALNQFGLLPRTLRGLFGLVTWPFLHGGWGHILANTLGILTVGALVLLRNRTHYWTVAAFGALVGGAGVWLVGREAFHVGASGVLFAWLGYLLSMGIFERRVFSILTSVAAFVLFGGMLWGVLPTMPGVSFEGHLFGFGAGVLAAHFLSRDARKARAAKRELPA